jgi:hypothetical protein
LNVNVRIEGLVVGQGRLQPALKGKLQEEMR